MLRLTITLHLFRWTCGETESPGLVDLASLEPAIGIFERYCVPMYDRVCKAFGEPEAHEGAARLCDYIRKKKLTRLRVADITKLHWQGMAERAAVLKALEALEDIDWLRRVASAPPGAGRRTAGWSTRRCTDEPARASGALSAMGAEKGGQRSTAAERRNSSKVEPQARLYPLYPLYPRLSAIYRSNASSPNLSL